MQNHLRKVEKISEFGPVPFISSDEAGFSVNGEAIRVLEKESRPVTIVSVVGPYRTGKSYLLNRLMRKTKGFPLGATLQAMTKGIWIWRGDFFGDPARALILLDTEGLDDPEKGDQSNDMDLFALSVLLSNVLVYNTIGTIDARALDGLRYATEISQFVMSDSRSDDSVAGQDFSKYFPRLIWTLRDQHLKLEINGEEVTANEYLEFCLKTKPGISSNLSKYNGIREAIRSFFVERDCIPFPAPVSNPAAMKVLETLPSSELSPRFVESGDSFADFVRNNSKPKLVYGGTLTGHSFSILAQKMADDVAKKHVCIESTYQYVIKASNEKAIEEAKSLLLKRLTMTSQSFPISSKNFNQMFQSVVAEATSVFLNGAINIDKHREFQEKLEKIFSELFTQFQANNQETSRLKCDSLLTKLFSEIENRIKAEEFAQPGGYKLLKIAIQNLEIKYFSETRREDFGSEVSRIFSDFSKAKFEPILQMTLQTDEKLTQNAKAIEKKKMERKRQEEIEKQRKAEIDKNKKEQIRMELAHEQSKRAFEAKRAEELRAELAGLKTRLKNEMEEQEKVLELGRKDLAADFERQIELLRQQITVLENTPVQVIEHHHYYSDSDSDCLIM